MAREHIEVISQIYEAFDRGDLAALFARLTPDAEVFESRDVPWGGVYTGQQRVGQYLVKLTNAIDSHVSVEHTIDAGDVVVIVGRARGTVRATGTPFDVPCVHVWQMRGNRAARFSAYIDHPTMLAALS